LPKYGADSALSSLVKRQITGSSDFGTSDKSSVRACDAIATIWVLSILA
jgi:hypothetical protein